MSAYRNDELKQLCIAQPVVRESQVVAIIIGSNHFVILNVTFIPLQLSNVCVMLFNILLDILLYLW